MGIKEIIDSSTMKIIDEQIKELWCNEIAKDYLYCRLLKEDSMKNAFYHHLRNRLGDVFLDEHNLQIYTEFNDGALKGTGKRADIAIVEIDENYEEGYLGNYISKILAVIELKFKASRDAEKQVHNDINKIKKYIFDDEIDCQYYLGVINETTANANTYLDDESENEWAMGKLTELVAYYDDDEMKFEIIKHEYER